jgi:hypothetical protein
LNTGYRRMLELVDDEGHGGPKMRQVMMAAIAEHTETD